MKNFKNIKILVLVLCILIFSMSTVTADPGGSQDPVVTLSYVNDVLVPQIKSYVDSSLSNFGTISTPLGDADFKSYEVVKVWAGQSIIGDQSCHIILRAGSATAITTAKGGLADVTSGMDLWYGLSIPANHLLIVPVGDGRGIKMQTDGIVMVSGKFTVR